MTAPPVRLTDKQRALIFFIEQYMAEHRVAPTLQEMAERFGVSKVTILQHLRALERKKVVKRQPYASRAIEIRTELLSQPLRPRVDIPFTGSFASNQPIESFPAIDTFDLTGFLQTQRECFVLRVKGDSLRDESVCDGDFLFLEQRDWARDGEPVVAVLPSGEAVYRRWFKEEDGVRLEPVRGGAAAIHVAEARIHGVVLGLLRRTAGR